MINSYSIKKVNLECKIYTKIYSTFKIYPNL